MGAWKSLVHYIRADERISSYIVEVSTRVICTATVSRDMSVKKSDLVRYVLSHFIVSTQR